MSVIDITGIPGINWEQPEQVTNDGKRIFSVRCRVPFSGLTPEVARKTDEVTASENALDLSDVAAEMALQERVIIDDGDGVELQPDATGDLGDDDEVNWGDLPLLSGIASSTSVDFYGTEMSMRALKQMAIQMMATSGVPYLPKHNNGSMGAIEWDEVIGRTVHAEVVPAEEVRKSYNPAETQFILRVTTRLYDDEEMSKSLLRRIRRGEPIGQSIGGWFTQLQVVQNDEGDVERVIVQGVELDHLAVTRAPANPDSIGLVSLRSTFQDQANMSKFLERTTTSDNEVILSKVSAQLIKDSVEERHICAWEQMEDDKVKITFKLSHDEDEDEDNSYNDDEMDEEYKKKKKKKYSNDKKSDAQLSGNDSELLEKEEPDTIRAVTKFENLSLADENLSWDWSTEAANAVLSDPPNWERYRAAHIWYDADNSEVKSAYKLPFAKMINGELRAVWRGVAAAMAAVNGARDSINISDEDRKMAYSHLVRYYEKFKKEAPEFQATIDQSIDNADKTKHSEPDNSDAGTSAPSNLNSTTAELLSKASEERVMNEQLIESLRSLLQAELQPLSERVQSLETRDEKTETVKEPTVEETVDPRITELERTAQEAMTRATAAEKKLDQLVRAPVRHGRAMTPHIDPGPAASAGYEGLVNRARTDCPTLSAVAERCISIVTEENGASTVSRRNLEESLRSLLNAATTDGIITDPTHRATWS